MQKCIKPALSELQSTNSVAIKPSFHNSRQAEHDLLGRLHIIHISEHLAYKLKAVFSTNPVASARHVSTNGRIARFVQTLGAVFVHTWCHMYAKSTTTFVSIFLYRKVVGLMNACRCNVASVIILAFAMACMFSVH